MERVVCEGGPTLNTALFAAGLVQEMFVTLSPLLAREPVSNRLAGAAGAPVSLELVSHAASGDFLFLRYRRQA